MYSAPWNETSTPKAEPGNIAVYIPHRFHPEIYNVDGGNVEEINEDIEAGDMNSIHLFKTYAEAKAWAKSYQGHQWVKIQVMFEV